MRSSLVAGWAPVAPEITAACPLASLPLILSHRRESVAVMAPGLRSERSETTAVSRASGFAIGSLGAFLVIEAREHAEKRGAKPLARLSAVVSGRANRQPGTVTASLRGLWDKIKDKVKSGHAAVLSGATGANPATAEEREFLNQHGDLAVRATGSYLGHGLEPQFPMNVALAAVAVGHGSLFPPCDSTGLERPMSGDLSQGLLQQVLVTGVGHWRGEALALVERVD